MDKKILFLIGLGALAFTTTTPALAASDTCGTSDKITIAEMTWPSAAALAQIHSAILSNGYGCKIELVSGDTVPTATSMATKGVPDIAPEFWLNSARPIWDKGISGGIIEKAADTFTDGAVEGWWIPKFVADANPGLKSVADLPKYKKLFVDPDDPSKGRFITCPPGWGCEIVNSNLFKAFKLSSSYNLFSPGSGANLNASIARGFKRKKPIVFYYWGPSAIMGKYDMVKLGMPKYNAAGHKCNQDKKCATPYAGGFPASSVYSILATSLTAKAPTVVQYMKKASIDNAIANKLLAWGDANKASSKEVAMHFLKTEEAVWTQWVSKEVAAKVKAGAGLN